MQPSGLWLQTGLTSSIASVYKRIAHSRQSQHDAQRSNPRSHKLILLLLRGFAGRARTILMPAHVMSLSDAGILRSYGFL